MSKIYLKVKIKSLAEEARIIRKEEYKAAHSDGYERGATRKDGSRHDGELFLGLKQHRKGIVREEARAALLAYAYLRGMPYAIVESLPNSEKRQHEHVWNFPCERVAKLCCKYGGSDNVTSAAIREWYWYERDQETSK